MTDYPEYDKKTYMIEQKDNPFASPLPEHSELLKASDKMILSASGWRKVFAAEGDEESFSSSVSREDLFLTGTAALVFGFFLQEENHDRPPVIFVGCDTRPTGPPLMDAVNRIFLALGAEVRLTGISAAPEIMATVKLDESASGFMYISASHNPVGHNGFKFGGSDGAVYGGTKSARLIEEFRQALAKPETIPLLAELSSNLDPAALRAVQDGQEGTKQLALERYRSFSREVISGSKRRKDQDEFFRSFSRMLEARPAGVIGELNGSARGASIDENFLGECGIFTEFQNGEPGKIVHRIVPEGSSLDLCRRLLLKAHQRNPAFFLGYVPDNDGDRGNLVFFDRRTGVGQAIAAQEVFALTVLSELAFEKYISNKLRDSKPLAVAVNGPTSMRIEAIARAFGAKVFRAEVGEANVVNLAAGLRTGGYRVRILGEGSNGGNITHPATVRDPLNTIFSILRLLAYRGEDAPFTPFLDWCRLSGQEERYRVEFDLGDIIEALPVYTTTSAYEDEAIMKIRCTDHGQLKNAYETLFQEQWEQRREELKEHYGITGWREINYEGIDAKTGFGPNFRTGKARGGLKIVFSNARGEDTDFIWMRGSGTEPVFRIMADCLGDDAERHDFLLNFHRNLIEEADQKFIKKTTKEVL